jgi:hypothetical protein
MGKRRSRRRLDTSGDFENLQICRYQSFEGAHRSRVCVCVFIGVSVYVLSACVVLCESKKDSYVEQPMMIPSVCY